MRFFIRFFAQRTLLASVITVVIIFLGLNALGTIQRDNFPRVDFQEMVVTTRYPGAAPEDVELNVTNKIEEELKEVDGIDKVTSLSMENISVIDIRLDSDVSNTEKIKTDVRDAVARVSDLPPEVDENPTVREITTATGIPVIEVGLTGDVPYAQLREVARRAEKALLNVPGVASLRKYGYLDREIKVEVVSDDIERYRIPTQEIVDAVRNRNIRATGGSFESFTSEQNIVTLAQFTEPFEVGEVIVRSSSDAGVIRVKDLAQLTDGFESPKVLSRMNSNPAISFLVYKQDSADLIRTVDAIKELVTDNRERLPDGVLIDYSNDTSRIVRNRLKVVMANGALGLLLVMVTLGMILDLRSALWVAMGIPVTLLGTLFLLPMFGAYLDSIALGAMILVIGIIVDDGIVIAENIWRNRELGLPPLDAAVEGTVSVFKPVLTTILTTAIAFAPMFFQSGILGSFVFVIPLVVVLALSISLIEVTLAMPAHLIAGGRLTTTPRGGARQRFFDRMREQFGRIAAVTVRWRYPVAVLFGALLAGAFWYAARYLDFVLFPTQSADTFYITAELASGSSLEYTADKTREIETLIMNLPPNELDSFATRIGTHGDFNLGENENWALFAIYLTPFAKRERDADEVVEDLRQRLDVLDGYENVSFIVDSGGPPVGRPITLRVVGSDDVLRGQLAGVIIDRLEAIGGVKDIDRDDKRGKDQVRIETDHLRLATYGLSVADISRAVRLAYDGEVVTSVRYGDEDVGFRVILESAARHSPDELSELVIPDGSGNLYELGELATFIVEPGPSNIYHFDNERAITVTADIVKGRTTPLQATGELLAGIDVDNDWPGLRIVIGGEAEETSESMASLYRAFITAAFGIYVVLLLLFGSLVQPILVMVTIPFGLIGVIFAFALHNQALGFLAMLGVIGLTGIVVNDSLILVNLVNSLRAASPEQPFTSHVVEGAKSRLRPIVLTSVTTVAGLLPMAYGIGGSDPFSAPMAMAMGYGILFATPLTLLLLPCLLTIQHDITQLFARLRARWRDEAV